MGIAHRSAQDTGRVMRMSESSKRRQEFNYPGDQKKSGVKGMLGQWISGGGLDQIAMETDLMILPRSTIVNSISERRKFLTTEGKFYLNKRGSSIRSRVSPDSACLRLQKIANQEAGNKTTSSTALRPRDTLLMKPRNASKFYNLTPIIENPIEAGLSAPRRGFGNSKGDSMLARTRETIQMNST
jgi:hypothetical protein